MQKPRIIYDLDETLCSKKQPHESYLDVKPIQPVIDQLNNFYDQGYEIIISTARNMVTQNNHVSKVVGNIGLDTMLWLEKYNIKYHGLDWGKEYGICYCDDKAIRPNELLQFGENLENLDKFFKNQNDLSILNNNINHLIKNNVFYVYQWYYINDNKKIVFYVGKGSKFRAWDIKGRNELFKSIIKIHECNVEIMEIFENSKDAIDYERKLKYNYISIGQCHACLDNLRGKQSPMKGKPAWNRSKNYILHVKHLLGKHQPKSNEHKQKISQSNIGKHNHNNENNPMAKLNECKIIEICKMLNDGLSSKDIMPLFNISECTISRIKCGTSWSHISKDYLK